MKKVKKTLNFQEVQTKVWDQYALRVADPAMFSYRWEDDIFAKKQALFDKTTNWRNLQT